MCSRGRFLFPTICKEWWLTLFLCSHCCAVIRENQQLTARILLWQNKINFSYQGNPLNETNASPSKGKPFFPVSASNFTCSFEEKGYKNVFTLNIVGTYLLKLCKSTFHVYQRYNTFDARLMTVKDGVNEVLSRHVKGVCFVRGSPTTTGLGPRVLWPSVLPRQQTRICLYDPISILLSWLPSRGCCHKEMMDKI